MHASSKSHFMHFFQKMIAKSCSLASLGKMPEKRLYQSLFIAIRAAQSTTYNYTPQMFPASVLVISKVAGRVSVVESLTSKVTRNFCSLQLRKELCHVDCYVPKSSSCINFDKFRSCWLTTYRLQRYGKGILN